MYEFNIKKRYATIDITFGNTFIAAISRKDTVGEPPS